MAANHPAVGLVLSPVPPRRWLGQPLMQRLSSDTAGMPDLRFARTVVAMKRNSDAHYYYYAHGLAGAEYQCGIRLEGRAIDPVVPPVLASSLRTLTRRDPSEPQYVALANAGDISLGGILRLNVPFG